MRRLRIGGKLLRVRDEPEPAPDPKRGPAPLLCVHGAGMSSVVFMDVVRRLPPTRRVIAPDLPGHGQSEPLAAGLSGAERLAAYRDAIAAVGTSLGVQRAVLLGHSMGGAVALLSALMWPEKVAGLVLLNSAAALPVTEELLDLLHRTLPGPGIDGGQGSAAASETDESPWVDRMPGELAELSFSPATAPQVRERWQAMLLAATRQTVLDDFAACKSFDVRERLGNLHVPTLLIGGADDLLVPPPQLAATAARIAGAELHIVPGTAHLTHVEQPDGFFALLSEFLRRV